jgi:hypothetical protein
MDSPKMIQSKISGLALDITTNSPVVTITWAISMEISGIVSKRPLTHDLLLSVIKGMKGEIERVDIVDLKEQTFYAVGPGLES